MKRKIQAILDVGVGRATCSAGLPQAKALAGTDAAPVMIEVARGAGTPAREVSRLRQYMRTLSVLI